MSIVGSIGRRVTVGAIAVAVATGFAVGTAPTAAAAVKAEDIVKCAEEADDFAKFKDCLKEKKKEEEEKKPEPKPEPKPEEDSDNGGDDDGGVH
ncbi:hypothetical protein [Nocardia iowensis]|uniref:Uncharacterized protein n=1 Tax=Nocardia iowensis TaxID=204891 RepID=A0ABX8RPJ7_NOCIO|nr:hypothetical protein [Nocardia iowensis]QXN90829.1 hypothetical protein KV110_36600 [Nocardia iowensis]